MKHTISRRGHTVSLCFVSIVLRRTFKNSCWSLDTPDVFICFLRFGCWSVHASLVVISRDELHLDALMSIFPSWELRYPLLKALFEEVFLFVRWDMLVPWRVYIIDCICRCATPSRRCAQAQDRSCGVCMCICKLFAFVVLVAAVVVGCCLLFVVYDFEYPFSKCTR